MAVLVVVDDRCPLQQELVNVWLQRQHVPAGGRYDKSGKPAALCVCAWVGGYFVPGNELSAVAESTVRLLRPLKLFILHQRLRRQVAL